MTNPLRRHRWLALLMALLLVAAACGRDDDGGDDAGDDSTGDTSEEQAEEAVEPSPGITQESVKIGATYPMSGNVSAYAVIAQAMDACFSEINEGGGIEMGDGVTRTVEYIIEDDQYLPEEASANARKLVEQDEVFMLLNPLGTPSNAAIREYMNEQEVPQVYVATGASMWGADHEEFPWTLGWQPAYPTESAIYGDFLKQEFPDGATVAVLLQNDDYGEDYLAGLEAAIDGSNIEIVATETYTTADPGIDSQMANLVSSGADVFFNVTTPRYAAMAIGAVGASDWEPLHLLNSVSNSKVAVLEPAGLDNAVDIYSTQYLMDPADEQWAEEPGMVDYFASVEEYGDFNALNPFGAFGYSVCATAVETFQNMEQPTREAFMDAARNLDFTPPLILPGITVKTGEGDYFPIEAMQIVQFDGDSWIPQGDIIDYEGNTPVPGE